MWAKGKTDLSEVFGRWRVTEYKAENNNHISSLAFYLGAVWTMKPLRGLLMGQQMLLHLITDVGKANRATVACDFSSQDVCCLMRT